MRSVAVEMARSEPRAGFGWLEPSRASLLEAIWPGTTFFHKLIASGTFILLIALLARARFFLPDNPVPITFQTFGVLVAGGVLGWRWGLVTILGYYLVGMAGVPVFQGGGNGWAYATGSVTGGYLLGFILATWVVGFASQHGWTHGKALWPMLLGNLFLYGPALIWLSVFDFGWPKEGELFSAAMYAFIPGDLIKLMLAALLIGGAWQLADRRNKG